MAGIKPRWNLHAKVCFSESQAPRNLAQLRRALRRTVWCPGRMRIAMMGECDCRLLNKLSQLQVRETHEQADVVVASSL